MTDFTTIRFRAIPFAAAVLFIALSVMNFSLIAWSLASFAGTLALVAMHPENFSLLLNSSTAEYWIAGIAWCSAPLFVFRKKFSRGTKRTGGGPNAPRWILYGYIFISFTAPIVAPLPPLAQASSLQHARFLPPLSKGIRSQSVQPLLPSTASGGFFDRIVLSANQYLQHRTISFSQFTDTPMVVPPAESAVGMEHSEIYFVFGTDGVGRDIFSRIVYGSRYSLGIGFLVVLTSIAFGSAAGMIAGYTGGFTDAVVMRTVDVLLSIPSLFLVLTLMAIIGQSPGAMIILLSATGWMGCARILRGEVLNLRHREFISASRLLGTSPAGILRLHILPNILPTIKNAGILQLGNIILAEASLSFLGLGIQAPEPSWGNMIADSMNTAGAPPFAAIFPGIALSLLIISVHIVGEQPR